MSKEQTLTAIAATQGGYFTAKQALSAGYSYRDQHYHTSRRNWIKEGHGIFRLAYYPLPPRHDLILLTLMSRDQSGQPHAVVSHESALALHEISDVNPAQVHLTVPPGFRKRMPDMVVLHKGHVPPADREAREGFEVTTPLRTLLDVAESPSSWPYLVDAVRDALEKGLIRPSHLLGLESTPQTRQWLISALEAAEERVRR